MMSRRSVSVVTFALVAALLLTAPRALAGEHVRAGHQTTRPQPAPVVVARSAPAPVTISLTVPAPATPGAADGAYISLRGPDGQLRRFAVEGGAEAVSSRVVVLRPGESLTIRLTTNK
jgi:hypothetical protein